MSLSSSSSSPLHLCEGIELSVPLAIGTLQWGTTWIDHTLINSKGVLPEDVCADVVDVVSSRGVTLFDTAEGYGGGTSEKRLGRLLARQRNRGGDKQGYVMMTKFLPAPWRLFYWDLERAVRASCERMQVDCIPVYLLHSPVHWLRPVEYWVEACAICYKKGLIKSMGLSNWYVAFASFCFALLR